MRYFLLPIFLCVLSGGLLTPISATTDPVLDLEGNGSRPEEEPLTLVSIKFDYVAQPLTLTTFFIIVGLVMIGYHFTGKLAVYFPETCVLVILGLLFGALFYKIQKLDEFALDERAFMLFFLPPIVLDAAFQLNNKGFTSNIGTVLLYAVVGTLVNFVFIGGCLYGLSVAGLTGAANFTLIDTFLFSSIIIAVDPVAVIAIFKAVGVNDQLYYLVFGESLFNDAVTIVVFDLMKSFTFSTDVTLEDLGMAVAAFFIHSLGAAVLGFLVGILSGLTTKFTTHLRIIEPALVYLLAYWAYLMCELLDWSGIIGLAVCCITQTQLAFQNLDKDSHTTVTNGASVIGVLVESAVFLFLGAETVRIIEDDQWNGMLILWTIILCLIGRIITVFGLTGVANPVRKDKIPLKEQLVMWWAGLRGALAFALSTTLHPAYKYRQYFIAATISFIFFTVFIMGITMFPVVKCMKIKMKDSQDSKEEEEKDNSSVESQPSSKISKLFRKAGSQLQRSLSQDAISKQYEVPSRDSQVGLTPDPDYEKSGSDGPISVKVNDTPVSSVYRKLSSKSVTSEKDTKF